jgi:hypothetical protein
VGFSLRLWGLDDQSLWYDEGTSAALATRALVEIARGAAADIHPPFYYAALAAWARVVGDSPFALRYLSVVFGTLTVAAVGAVGVRFGGVKAGALAAGAAALSPYLVWYSQEVRAYGLAAFLATVLVYVGHRLGGEARLGRKPLWAHLGALALTTAALYTHYFCGAVAAGVGSVAFLAGLVESPPRGAIRDRALLLTGPRVGGSQALRPAMTWVGFQAAAVSWFVPWLLYAGGSLTSWPPTSPPYSLAEALARYGTTAAFGTGLQRVPQPLESVLMQLGIGDPAGAVLLLTLTVVGLAVLGLAALATGRRDAPLSQLPTRPPSAERSIAADSGRPPSLRFPTRLNLARVVLLGSWASAAPLGLWLLSQSRPAWNAKFLSPSVPAVEVLVGLGILAAARLTMMASAALRPIAHRAASSQPVHRGALPDRRARTTLRRLPTVAVLGIIAAGVAAMAVPRLIVLATVVRDPMQHRDDYRGIVAHLLGSAESPDAVVLTAPTQLEIFDYYADGRLPAYPLPLERPPDPAAVNRDLDAIGMRHRDLYAVLWADQEADPDGLVVQWLNLHRHKASETWYGNVRLGRWLAPRGVLIPTATDAVNTTFAGQIRLARAAVDRSSPDAAILELEWEAVSQSVADYVVFIQLLDATGNFAAGRDMAPVGGTERTSTWGPGHRSVDRIALAIPTALHSGEYSLIVGLYDPTTGERLPAVSAAERNAHADHVHLGTVSRDR